MWECATFLMGMSCGVFITIIIITKIVIAITLSEEDRGEEE